MTDDPMTEDQAAAVISRCLENRGTTGMTEDEIATIFDEFHSMKIGAVMLEMVIDGKLVADVQDGEVVYSTWPRLALDPDD